jgi:poly(3-hydroxybutyrate) depolymerase
MLKLLVGLVALGLACLPARALDVGDHILSLPEATGMTADPIRVFVHRPASWRPDGPVLVVMHGVQRDADRYLAEWRDLAAQAGVLVICPEFSTAKYPGVRWYNLGNVMDRERNGVPQPAQARTFPVIDRAFAEVRRQTGATREHYALFGHSAGAQFVHRYLLFAEETRADPIIVANSGWYTLPTTDIDFPYGLGRTGVGEDAIRRALARPVTILLGDQDNDPNYPNLRRNAEADVQGLHRFARGQFYMRRAQEEAARLGVPLAWRMQVVEGVGHVNAGMAQAAIRIVSAAR